MLNGVVEMIWGRVERSDEEKLGRLWLLAYKINTN